MKILILFLEASFCLQYSRSDADDFEIETSFADEDNEWEGVNGLEILNNFIEKGDEIENVIQDIAMMFPEDRGDSTKMCDYFKTDLATRYGHIWGCFSWEMSFNEDGEYDLPTDPSVYQNKVSEWFNGLEIENFTVFMLFKTRLKIL